MDLQSNIWQNLAEDVDSDGHTMEFNGTQWVLDPGDLNGVDDDANGFIDDLIGWSFFTNNGDANPIPGNPMGGHGTHCAGVSDGATNNGIGIASISWNVKVMGNVLTITTHSPMAGMVLSMLRRMVLILFPIVGVEADNFSKADQEAVNYAAGLGSVVLAAAGNDNISPLSYPAYYQDVISVAAVSADDTKTGYSNYNLAVDISAPGGGTGWAY